jgi:UDP-N-acetylmuramoylalanine--D-glutamate ligase
MDTTAVIGMGRTGQSVVRFLQSRHVPCVAYDEKPCELPSDLNVPLRVGPLDGQELSRYRRLIVSPGVPWFHPALDVARQAGAEVTGDLALFVQHYDGDILAVTGTNGKTTTVSLIALLLETLPNGVESGGNIGTPVLDLLSINPPPPRVVLELSSFQLERTPEIRPCWAVLLNVQPDHADMHESYDQYLQAKLRMFDRQGAGDTALLPLDGRWNGLADKLRSRGVKVQRFGRVTHPDQAVAGLLTTTEGCFIFWHQNGRIRKLDTRDLKIRGSYQHINLAVAAQAAARFEVTETVIREALTAFQGLPHRLQSLGIHADREWIDDSKATNPDAAMAALREFDHVLWICGGMTKGIDLEPMRETVATRVQHAFIIGRKTKPFETLLKHAGVPATRAGTMDKAVRLAARQQPCPVLLSPAAASQDQFENYVQRGRVFARAVNGLEKIH